MISETNTSKILSVQEKTLFDKNLADLISSLRKLLESFKRFESENSTSIIEPRMLSRLVRIIHDLEVAAQEHERDDEPVLAPLLLLNEVMESIGEISRWSKLIDSEGEISKVLKSLKNVENRGSDFLSMITALKEESKLIPTLQKLTGIIQEKRHLIAKRIEDAREEQDREKKY